MTFAGKKLQEIYDSGSQSLVEMETKVSENMKGNAQSHANERKNGDDDSTSRIEQRTNALESDLRTFMDDSIERLKKVMDEELKETEDHLVVVKQDLTGLADRLKTSIVDLRKSYEEQVGETCASLSDQFEGESERTTIELEKQDYASTKHIKAQGTFISNSLQQKLDHTLWESRGEEKQYNTQLFKTFMQKANNIDTHFSALMQQVSSEFQEQFKALEGSSNHGEEELNGESKKLSHAIDTFSIETEASMNEFFRGVLEGHNKNLDNSLSSIAQDLSSVHDATTEKLSEQTRQLSSNLVTASGEAREGLSTRCQDLRDKVDTMLAAFIARMDEKVKTSLVLRENLEKEKDSIFTGIRGELAQIKAGYEKKLTNLMNEGVNRVNTIASDCERDMQAAHERCQSQLKSDAQTMRDDIEKEIQEFTQMLTTVRTATLDEIAKSAGAAGQDQKASDNRSGRRTRKKDESSDTEG
jgi:hypothetical protein